MNSLIINALKPLGIKAYFMAMPVGIVKPSEYVMFSVVNERELDIVDDKPSVIQHQVALSFWYNTPVKLTLDKIPEIKRLMKANGFSYVGSKDLIDSESNYESGSIYFGKYFDFEYIEYI